MYYSFFNRIWFSSWNEWTTPSIRSRVNSYQRSLVQRSRSRYNGLYAIDVTSVQSLFWNLLQVYLIFLGLRKCLNFLVWELCIMHTSDVIYSYIRCWNSFYHQLKLWLTDLFYNSMACSNCYKYVWARR